MFKFFERLLLPKTVAAFVSKCQYECQQIMKAVWDY
jgi:hypothetical protein